MRIVQRFGIVLGLMLSASIWAQTPPPEVDKALRERIAKFFQAHVEGKYRQAEQYIAEENRDEFYNNAKTKYVSFGESQIEYADNFTKALVHTPTEMIWRVAQLGEMQLKKQVESFWKVVDGQWYWYQPPGSGMLTPFSADGKPARMQPGPSNPRVGMPETVSDRVKNFNPNSLRQVEISKSEVRLNRKSAADDELVVTNNMPGVVKVQADYSEIPGFAVTITPQQLKPGEVARVHFTYTPKPSKEKIDLRAKLVIQPTMQTFPLAIVFVDDLDQQSKQRVK